MIEQYINIRSAGGGGSSFTITPIVSDSTPVYGDTITFSVTSPTVTLTDATWYVDGIQVATGTSTTWKSDYLYGPLTVTCVATDGTGYGEDMVAIDVKVRPYDRPSDWLDIDSLVSVGDQKIVGLFAVFQENSNVVAFRCQGAYQVDWGDGTITTHASNTTAQYSYTYSSISPSTDCVRGYRQVIITITPQAGQNLTLFNCSLYRYSTRTWNYVEQWLDVKMSAPNLTSFSFNGGSSKYLFMLEKFVYVGTTSLTSLQAFMYANRSLRHFEVPSITGSYQTIINFCTNLEYFDHDFSGATSFVNAFAGSGLRYLSGNFSSATSLSTAFQTAQSLMNVNITNIPGVTCDNMFYQCYSIRKANLTGTPTSALRMFYYCRSLETPPDGLTCSSITNAGEMFIQCSALKRNLAAAFSSCTNMSSMYYFCANLVEIDMFDMSACQNAFGMFALCTGLRVVPTLDTSNVTNNAQMFDSCYSLVSVGNLDFSSVTRWGQPNTGAFTSCYSLTELPTLDFAGTSTDTYGNYRTFINMYSLRRLDMTNTGAVTGWQEFVRSCYSLAEIGPCDMSSGTNFSAAFSGCYNLRRMQGTSIKVTVSFQQCALDATAIDEIFTNLAVVVGQTITVSQNPGSSTCNTAIATGKGWTVVT